MPGPTLPFCDELHAQKYRGPGESFREAMSRVASALTCDPEEYHRFRDILLDMRFLPAGRVQAAMGSTKNVTPYNCFVSGTIEDSFVEGHGSIMNRASEAATTMRMGGGIGYDFSTLRPRGATIKKLASRSSGPISFMSIYDAICRCIASSGHRRGAQMGVMRIDHPDIEEFIHAKQNQDSLTGFNVSVAVTDEFMIALREEWPFRLRFGGEVYKEVQPRVLWESIMRSTWDWAEPGVLFIDRINEMNNLSYCETIAATNPCGEQPLPPHGACLLGSFNLTRYVMRHPGVPAFINWEQLSRDVPIVVRAMDRVVDLAEYPLYEQEKEAKRKRRMGLGVTGLANALEAIGMTYGSADFLEQEQVVLGALRDEAYRASALLAEERGAFPAFSREKYLDAPFIRNLPGEVRDLIAKFGIRNSHLTSIAPTGTISLAADNISSGIEPVFAHSIQRAVFMEEGRRSEEIPDYGVRVFGVYGKTAKEVTASEHLEVLKAAVPFVDSSISKTCNVPSDTPWNEFQHLYVEAWEAGCKGLTTYQMDGRREAVLSAAKPEEAEQACKIDSETGRRDCE